MKLDFGDTLHTFETSACDEKRTESFYIDLHFPLFIDIIKIWNEDSKFWKTSENRLKCIKSTEIGKPRVDQVWKCGER